jgi:hypothetical protein
VEERVEVSWHPADHLSFLTLLVRLRSRPRVVPQMDCPMKVHRSVKLRMQDPNLNYTPRVKFEREPIFVD